MALSGTEIQAAAEVKRLIGRLDDVLHEYLMTPGMDRAQRIVNCGRAINALHVAWIANLAANLEQRHGELLKEVPDEERLRAKVKRQFKKRDVPAFNKVTRKL